MSDNCLARESRDPHKSEISQKERLEAVKMPLLMLEDCCAAGLA